VRQEGEEPARRLRFGSTNRDPQNFTPSRLSLVQEDDGEVSAEFEWPSTLSEMIEEVRSGTARLNGWLADGTITSDEYIESYNYNQLLIEICQKIQEAQGSDYLPPLSSDVWE
jgi:hypothetical protein